MTRGKLLAVLVTVVFALPGCVQDDGSCATYGAGEKTDFYHVGSGESGTIDASWSSDGENETWNCCNVSRSVGSSTGPVQGGTAILGYIFGIATEEVQTEQQDFNITLHGTNYSTDELEPRPSGEIGGSCFFGELTWSNHRGTFTHDGASYWGLFIEETVVDFANGGDANVAYEANASVEIFVVMKTSTSFA